jgi:DNA-directed RNA polymerase specialized sigma24 family protein
MDEREFPAQQFEEHRTRLRAVAYRMLGSLSEADDAVQEARLRLSRVDADEVENLGGWLTTVVARVSLNMLRSRRSRRDGRPFTIAAFTIRDGRIVEMDIVADPETLGRVDLAILAQR